MQTAPDQNTIQTLTLDQRGAPNHPIFIEFSPVYISYSQFFLMGTIAIVTAYIAVEQWKINKQKLKLDLYERRYKIYEQVMSLIVKAVIKRNLSQAEIDTFPRTTEESRFLFGSEIFKYVTEVQNRAIDFHLINASSRYKTGDANTVEKVHKQHEWFKKQVSIAPDKFKKYLHLDNA